MVRIPARMGPMHGVQPKAKANPTRNAPASELLPFRLCSRLSAYRALILKMPTRCRPNRMMTTPATRVSHLR